MTVSNEKTRSLGKSCLCRTCNLKVALVSTWIWHKNRNNFGPSQKIPIHIAICIISEKYQVIFRWKTSKVSSFQFQKVDLRSDHQLCKKCFASLHNSLHHKSWGDHPSSCGCIQAAGILVNLWKAVQCPGGRPASTVTYCWGKLDFRNMQLASRMHTSGVSLKM